METLSSAYEWTRSKRASVGTATTDCMLSIPSTIVGIGFFVWALILHNTVSTFSTVGCPMVALRTLVLINGIIDLVFPLFNLLGKSMRVFEIGYRRDGSPGPLNMMFESVRGCSIGTSITSLVILGVILFGGSSGYCPITNKGDYDRLRTYAIVNIVVNVLGSIISSVLGCIGIGSGFFGRMSYRPLKESESESLYQSASA